MKWQDFILGAGSICFTLALIPAIRAKEKPPLKTSLLTSVWLYTFAVVYASYSLWFSLATGLATATAWAILAVQRINR